MYDRSHITIAALTILALGLPLSAHADGKATYDTYCASCHGMEGRGDGPVAEALIPRPTNFQDPAYWSRLGPGGDIHILRYIKQGGRARDHASYMPAWEAVLTEEQIRELIVYLRRLAADAAFGESTDETASEPSADPPVEPSAVPPAKPLADPPTPPAQSK